MDEYVDDSKVEMILLVMCMQILRYSLITLDICENARTQYLKDTYGL